MLKDLVLGTSTPTAVVICIRQALAHSTFACAFDRI